MATFEELEQIRETGGTPSANVDTLFRFTVTYEQYWKGSTACFTREYCEALQRAGKGQIVEGIAPVIPTPRNVVDDSPNMLTAVARPVDNTQAQSSASGPNDMTGKNTNKAGA